MKKGEMALELIRGGITEKLVLSLNQDYSAVLLQMKVMTTNSLY